MSLKQMRLGRSSPEIGPTTSDAIEPCEWIREGFVLLFRFCAGFSSESMSNMEVRTSQVPDPLRTILLRWQTHAVIVRSSSTFLT